MKKPAIFIVTYHSVADIAYPFSVHTKVFDAQIAYIKKHYEPLSLAKFIEVVEGKYVPKRDAVLVTFDDGVEDNYTNAFPILKKHEVPAVIFFATDYEGKLHSGPQGFAFRFLSWAQAKEMVDSGLVRIESHTHTHPLLPRVPLASVEPEFILANEAIEKYIGYKPVSIAYPKGEWNDAVVEIARRHYRLGFAGAGGYVTLPIQNTYTIERMMITQEIGMVKFALMLQAFPWRVRNSLRSLKQRIYGKKQ